MMVVEDLITDPQVLTYALLLGPCILIAWSESAVFMDSKMLPLIIREVKGHILFVALCELSPTMRAYNLMVEGWHYYIWRKTIIFELDSLESYFRSHLEVMTLLTSGYQLLS